MSVAAYIAAVESFCGSSIFRGDSYIRIQAFNCKSSELVIKTVAIE